MSRAFVPFYPPSCLVGPKIRLINIGPLYILIGFSVIFLHVVLIFLCISDRAPDRPKKLFTEASVGKPMSLTGVTCRSVGKLFVGFTTEENCSSPKQSLTSKSLEGDRTSCVHCCFTDSLWVNGFNLMRVSCGKLWWLQFHDAMSEFNNASPLLSALPFWPPPPVMFPEP